MQCSCQTQMNVQIRIFNPNVGGGGNSPPPPSWFSLNNSKTIKAITLNFAAFSNILLKTFVPYLVSITRSSLQILGKTQTGVLPISGFLANCHNSRTSDDIDVNLGPVTKINNKNKTSSKKK